jgi:autotransporter passenger strand-loop-strand repeat protein
LAISPDGTLLLPAEAGSSLVTSAGTWTFSGTSAGNLQLLLNGSEQSAGYANGDLMEVTSGGNLFEENTGGGWYEWNGTGWTALANPNPLLTTAVTSSLAYNAAAEPLGIPAPSDPKSAGATIMATVTSLPDDGIVLLSNGVTPVTVGETLSVAQLTTLKFNPTGADGLIGSNSALCYTVSDPDGSAPGVAVLSINAGAPSSAGATLSAGLAGALVTSAGVWTFGGATDASGTDIVLNGTMVSGGFAVAMEVANGANLYAEAAQQNWSVWNGSAFVSAANPNDPQTTPVNLGVYPGAAATPIGIAAPTDLHFSATQLTVTVSALPNNGTVSLDGVPVSVGQSLTVAQLRELEFQPSVSSGQISQIAYTIKDPNNLSSTASATLTVVSPDGSLEFSDPGGATSLTTVAGTWTFGAQVGASGYEVELNGVSTGESGFAMEVAQGNLYLWIDANGNFLPNIIGGGWQEYQSGGFINPFDGPQIALRPISPPPFAENAGPTPINIPGPTYPAPYTPLVITVTGLPTNGTVTLPSGAPLPIDQGLSLQQLEGLRFQPTPGLTSGSSVLTYETTLTLDDLSQGAAGTVMLTIGSGTEDSSNGSVLYPLTGGELITNHGADVWTFSNVNVGSDELFDILLNGQFVSAGGQPVNANELEVENGQLYFYSEGTDGVYSDATQSFAGTLLPNTLSLAASGQLVLSETPVHFTSGSGPRSFAVPAPSDPLSPGKFTITVFGLPNDGTVYLNTGGTLTPISAGQTLTTAQLTSDLEFKPGTGVNDAASLLQYSVSDSVGGYGAAAVSLVVGSTVSVTTPTYAPPPPAPGLWQDPPSGAVAASGIEVPPTVAQPAALGTGVVGFNLQNTGSTPEAAGYVTFGQVFRDGDVGSGTALVADIVVNGTITGSAAVQMDVGNRYADGSVEQAVLTVAAPSIPAGGTVELLLAAAPSPPPGSAITAATALSDLQANDVTVALSISGFGDVTLSAAQVLSAAINAGTAAENQVLSGPLVSEFDVSTTVDGGKLEVEFDIRTYADGSTSTDVVFSTADTAIVVSASSAISPAADVDYSVTISGGVTSASYSNLQQYAYSTWDQEVYSSDSINPNVQYDVDYLIATGAIQPYDTSYGVLEEEVLRNSAGLTQTNPGPGGGTGPLQTAGVAAYMPDAGSREDIAVEPNWVTEWLLSQNSTAESVMMADAFAGEGVPWHFDDAETGLPINIQTYPNFIVGDTAQGSTQPSNGWPTPFQNGDPWAYDDSHMPDLNYVPYLITGNQNQLQQIWAQADFAILDVGGAGSTLDSSDQVSLGFAAEFINSTIDGVNSSNGNDARGVAWELREVAEAAYITPTTTAADRTMKNYFTNQLNIALNGLVQEYINDNADAQYGQLTGIFPAPANYRIAPWEEDYMVMSLAEVAGMNLGQASADAVAMLKFMNNFVSGLFTNAPNGYNPLDGTPYYYNVNNPINGQPYTTWGQLFNANLNLGFNNITPGTVPFPAQLINAATETYGGFGPIAKAALADEVTYTETPQAMQAYGFVVSQIAYAFTLSEQNEAAAYQQFSQFDIVPRLPDDTYLENSQTLIDTSGDPIVTLTGSAGVDMLLSVVGSGTAKLTGESAVGGVDLIYGGAGSATLYAGQGNDYLFGGTGNTAFVAGGGSDYLQGGSNATGPGTSDTTSNTFEITALPNAGGRVITIADFNPQNDRLEIGAHLITASSTISSASQLLSGSTYVTPSGGNTVIQLDPGLPGSDEIILLGVNAGLLSASVGGGPGMLVVTYPSSWSSGILIVSSFDDVTSAVLDGATVEVIAGGETVNLTVSNGSSELVSGGIASATIVLDQASLTVLADGATFNTVVSAGGTEFVSAGGTASGTIISDGGAQDVSTGGTAIGATIEFGGSQTVSGAAAVTANTTVEAGGSQFVSAGGTASGGGVSGNQIVLTNGTAVNAVVQSGGSQTVAGGTASGTTVSASGNQSISAGGTATGGTIAGSQTIFAGGNAVSVAILAGGNQLVSSGGVADDTTISAGGGETILSSGTANGTVVSSGGSQFDFGLAIGTTIAFGGSQTVGAGVASDTTIASGGSQTVFGSATGTVVSSGGLQTISGGGTANGGTIAGSQTVAANGTAIGAGIAAGGVETVAPGGVANATTVSSGGAQYVNGSASDTIVSSGGGETVSAGGTATGGTVAGSQTVLANGTAVGTDLVGGGVETISSGGVANTVTVSGGGTQNVYGSASGTIVSSGGDEVISAGGSATGTQILNGGSQTVLGSAVDTAVSAGGTQVVSASGQAIGGSVAGTQTITLNGGASGVAIVDGGVEVVSAGGSATGTVILNGGSQTVLGTASGTTVSNGGTETVSAGGVASGTLLLGNGTLILAGGSAFGTIYGSGASATIATGTLAESVVSGGALTVSNGGTLTNPSVDSGTLTAASGGTISSPVISGVGNLVLDGGAIVAGGITFASGATGTLTASANVTLSSFITNTITGFGPGDTIDLAAYLYTSKFTVSFSASDDVLDIISGGTTIGELVFSSPPAAGQTFVVFNDPGTVGIGLAGLENNNPLGVAVGGSGTISQNLLDFTDPSDTHVGATADQLYTITSVPSDGTLFLNDTALTAGGTFTQQEIDSNEISYRENGTNVPSDSFGFTVTDRNTGHTASGTFIIDVFGQPTISVVSPQTVQENRPSPIAAVVVNDGAAALTSATVSAVLRDSTGLLSADTTVAGGGGTIIGAGTTVLTITGLLSQLNADLTTLTDNLSSVTSDTITVSAGDNSGATATPKTISIIGSSSSPPPLSNVVVSAAQTLVVSGGQTGSDITVLSGGALDVDSGGNVSGVTLSGGALQLANGANASDFIGFAAGTSSTVAISGTTMPSATISGFAPGDTLDLVNLAFSNAGTLAITSDNVLQISEDGGTYSLDLDPSQDFVGSIFQLSEDSAGGTLVTESTTQSGDQVVWTDPTTGQTGYWTFNADGSLAGFDNIGNANTNYTPAGIGDFDDNGYDEVLFEDKATGDTGHWIANTSNFDDFGMANTNYSVVGVGDFDNSGDDEVLFEDEATGDTGYWLANSTAFHDFGMANANYTIVGVGDFDGSGRDEVLFEDEATGDTGYWLANSTTFHNLGTANTNYTIVGVGDFNGAGEDEILWEDKATGNTGYWLPNSTTFHDFGFSNTNYEVVGVGDYNGSGRDTVLWEDPTTGAIGYWPINAAGTVTGFVDLQPANTNFHIVSG